MESCGSIPRPHGDSMFSIFHFPPTLRSRDRRRIVRLLHLLTRVLHIRVHCAAFGAVLAPSIALCSTKSCANRGWAVLVILDPTCLGSTSNCTRTRDDLLGRHLTARLTFLHDAVTGKDLLMPYPPPPLRSSIYRSKMQLIPCNTTP